MPKVKQNQSVIIEFKDGSIKEEFLPLELARERFNFLVSIATELGFDRVRSIRLVRGGHVSFEYRDIRSIVNQTNLLAYDENYI